MRSLLTALVIVASTVPALAEVPRVVATVKPLHSLVAAVMGDLGSPDLIVKGGASPHTYSLRPSDAANLEDANVVFWTGHGLELFLEDSIETLAPKAKIVELSETPGIELLPVREGGAFEAHSDEGHDQDHAGLDHEHGEMDMHFWLDPVNAEAMVSEIAATLAAADPEHAATYKANADAERARLATLVTDIEAKLAPVKGVPFIVFHDAYQYFERRFGLAVAGSITVTPDTLPGAQRIKELHEKVAGAGAACVFAEPQFEPAVVGTIIEGTSAKAGTLDPEGAGLTEGPGLYGELITGLADGLVDCLGR
ncbi:MAG TPA: zinc ABC transporter substrate-binding protein [Devosia sp.]|nr:zinc ABC transporter substrate-binding protein [Devosia sp.]